MIQITSSIARATQSLAFASLFTLGLAACGASPVPIGESQQPISDDGSEESGNDACTSGVAPADARAGECTITARALCFTNRAAACACAGCGLDECAIAESFPEQAVCPSSGGGSDDPETPVSDDPDAPVSNGPGDGVSGSAGGGGTEPRPPGGGSDDNPGCDAPSDPNAPSGCDGGHAADANGRCDFVVDNVCFDSAESACACAGCGVEQCAVLESYPAQINCL